MSAASSVAPTPNSSMHANNLWPSGRRTEPAPPAGSREGSASSSCNPSQHGGSLFGLASFGGRGSVAAPTTRSASVHGGCAFPAGTTLSRYGDARADSAASAQQPRAHSAHGGTLFGARRERQAPA